jgi:single-stranded DNA-binding protein
MKMLGGKDDAAPMGGNEQGYETSYEEHQTPAQTSTQQRAAAPTHEYPEIDINEDEIPF